MDLLGGYNSDSDSDSDSSPPASVQAKAKTTKPPPSVNSDKKISTTSSALAGSKSASSSSRKGKRLLKLQAVLPENIWNQLSNGNLQKDSDDEGKAKADNNKRSAEGEVTTEEEKTTQ